MKKQLRVALFALLAGCGAEDAAGLQEKFGAPVDLVADEVSDSAASLRLQLGAGIDVVALRTSAERTGDGALLWRGTLAGLPEDAPNSVLLVKSGDRITGSVQFNDQLFRIQSVGRGRHAVRRMPGSPSRPDHPPAYDRLPVIDMKEGARDGLAAAATATIRLLVNYTPAAAAAAGDINGLIGLAIAETNQGYANAGVNLTVQLAAAERTTYTETGNFDTDLARYRTTGDGHMDEIHTRRNAVAADVAVLIVNNTAYCGLASSIGSTATSAFVEVYWDCATGYYSFAHEIGHLLSARHDPKTDPSTQPYAYGHGYRYEPKRGNTRWRTIMAYNCPAGCPRLNYWSNPGVRFGGVPMGTAAASDNHRVLNLTGATIAAFR